jgi:hypothetical protein
VSVKDALKFNVARHGRTIILTSDFSDVPNVFPYHVCPGQWKLSGDELDCIYSSAYDSVLRRLRVTIVDREPAKAEAAAARVWEESSPDVDPKKVSVGVAGMECLGGDSAHVALVHSIARAVIASAVSRGPECGAKISPFAKTQDGHPDFMLSVSGLRVVGPNSFDPKRWGIDVPPEIASSLRVRFSVKESEHQTGIFRSALIVASERRDLPPKEESTKSKRPREDDQPSDGRPSKKNCQ